jgi:hypothetical protein
VGSSPDIHAAQSNLAGWDEMATATDIDRGSQQGIRLMILATATPQHGLQFSLRTKEQKKCRASLHRPSKGGDP